jgi:hypothetical protein
MKYYFLFSFLSTLSIFGISQNSEAISKNQFTFSLSNGLNASSSKLVIGERTPEKAYGIAHGFNFHYSRILSSSFSLSGGFGLGFLPINMKVKSFENYIGNEDWKYFSKINYKAFTKYEILLSYRKNFNEKYGLKLNLGTGINHYGGSGFGTSSGVYDPITESGYNIYEIDVKFTNSPKPYSTIGVELTKNLKNEDIFALKLNYEYSFKNAYSGTYSIYNGTSKGEYFNRGNYFNVAFAYTMTGNKRLSRLNQLKTENKLDKKTAKRTLKKENRYIDPKSTFLSFTGGLGVGMNKVEVDQGAQLMKAGYASFMPRFSIEKGIKNNFYAELGLHSQLFWDVTKFKIAAFGSSGGDAFYAYQFSFGGVYRWILKNNYNILNFHSGFTLGYHNARNLQNGLASWGGGGLSGENNNLEFNYEYDSQTRIKSNILASYYFGFSKDFRIVNNFYFTINYRQQLGLIKASETTYNYSGKDIPTIQGAKTKIDGTSRDFQIGFKIKFSPKNQ